MIITAADWRSVDYARKESGYSNKQTRLQWTTRMVRQLKELMEQGVTTEHAAAEMGITVQQAKRARQRYLIKSRGRAAPRWTDEHQSQAIEMLRAGHTKKHVAETLDVSRQTIRRRTRGLV